MTAPEENGIYIKGGEKIEAVRDGVQKSLEGFKDFITAELRVVREDHLRTEGRVSTLETFHVKSITDKFDKMEKAYEQSKNDMEAKIRQLELSNEANGNRVNVLWKIVAALGVALLTALGAWVVNLLGK